MSDSLGGYIKKQREQGKSDSEIKDSLLKVGWSEQGLDKALNTTSQPNSEDSNISVGLRSPIQLFNISFEIYKRRFRTLLSVLLVPVISLILMTLLWYIGLILAGESFLFSVLMILLLLVFTLVVIVTQSWGYAAMLYAIVGHKENLGFVDAFKKGRKKIFSYWWILWIEGFIMLGGFLLLFIPGIVFFVWFSLAMYVMVSEDLTGLNAILKSREYVKGKWWGVFGRLLFLLLILGVIYIFPSLVFEHLNLAWVGSVITSVINLLIGPFVAIYAYLIYEDLKQEKNLASDFSVSKRKKIGFVLVGLLGGLIVPLGIVAMIALVAINPSEQLSRARDAGRKMDQATISRSLEMYYVENGEYPVDLNLLVPEYIGTLPKDPDTDINYEYDILEEGQSYQFCVIYEETGRECTGPLYKDMGSPQTRRAV